MADILKLKKKAADLEAKKQMDKALDVYREIVAAYENGDEDPIDIPLYNRVGDMLQKAGSLPEAVSVWEKAVDHYAEGGFFNPAIALCNKILRASPGRTVIYYKLGKIHAEKGFKGDARQNFLEYASRQQKAGNLDDAFKALKEFADLVPDQHDVRLMLADQLVKAGRKDEAIQQLQFGYTQAVADGRDAAAEELAARMKDIDPSVEPKAEGPSAPGGGGGLVFLDLDPAPTRRPSRSGATRVTKAIAGLDIIMPPEDEPAAATVVAAAPPAPAPAPAEPEPEPIVLEPTAVDEAPPAAPAAALDGLELTSFGEETVADAPADVPALEIEATNLVEPEAAPPEVPLLDLEPTALDTPLDTPVIEIEVAGSLVEELVVEPPAELPWEPTAQAAAETPSEPTAEAPAEPTVGASAEPSRGAEAAAPPEPALEASREAAADLPLLELPELDVLPAEAPQPAVEPNAEAIAEAAPREAAAPKPEDTLLDLEIDIEDKAPEPAPLDDLPILELEPSLSDDLSLLEVEPSVEESVPLFSDAPFLGDIELLDGSTPVAGTPAVEEQRTAADEPAVAEEPAVVEEPAVAEEPAIVELASADRDTPVHVPISVEEWRDRVIAAPEDWGIRRAYAEALLEYGSRDDALAELEVAMTGYEVAGDLETAGSVAEEIVRLEPASIRHHQKRVELAVRSNQRTRLAEAYVELADALFTDGQLQKARAVYQRVLDINPDDLRAQAAIESIPVEAPQAPEPPPRRSTTAARRNSPSPSPKPAPPKLLPEDDGDFVSLGDLLRDDDEPKSTRLVVAEQEPTGDEQADFEDMLRKFKQGISENVGDEDHEAHYDLGVAYKEMGLLDEAIAEFQKALRGTAERARTFESLGLCFVEKGQLPVASTILQRALAEPNVGDEALVGVLYLLGAIAEELQQFAEAKQYYQRVFAVDIQFRDIGDRLNVVEQRLS